MGPQGKGLQAPPWDPMTPRPIPSLSFGKPRFVKVLLKPLVLAKFLFLWISLLDSHRGQCSHHDSRRGYHHHPPPSVFNEKHRVEMLRPVWGRYGFGVLNKSPHLSRFYVYYLWSQTLGGEVADPVEWVSNRWICHVLPEGVLYCRDCPG